VTAPSPRDTDTAPPDWETRLEHHRVELTGFCYRMLGSPFEAEDAVQETFVRAWRHGDRYDEDRAPLKSWLFAIATNVCLDMLRSAQRRARAVDLGPPSRPGTDLGAPLPESAWVLPAPDHRVLGHLDNADPAEVVAQRESIRLAFVAALQQLPPRQRAVLILRDVLCWSAAEVARLFDTSVASVTSALQRARATLAPATGIDPGTGAIPAGPRLDEAHRRLLDRYCAAFERHDVDTLVALLHEDATMSMPPFTWWLRGRADLHQVLLAPGMPCEGARLVPVAANGSPAFGQYQPTDRGHQPFALLVVDVADGLVTGTTTYLTPERLFPLFGLPPEPPPR
jgi:RNA polymerase sigma-70 factor (ECF subfamily)